MNAKLDKLLATRRWCYWIAETCTHTDGQYIPCMIIEGESGYYPMSGDPAKFQTPWLYGKDIKVARETVDSLNAQRGITKEIAKEIYDSSILQSIRASGLH